MIKPEVLDAMLAAGCTAEQIVAAVKADMGSEAEREAERREKDRQRQRARRNRKKQTETTATSEVSRGQSVTKRDTADAAEKVSPPHPLFQNDPPAKKNPPTGVKKKDPPSAEPLLEVLDQEHTLAVLEHRQKIRKPLTPRAAKLLAEKFARCPDPNAAADAMIANGWQGFEPEWLDRRGSVVPLGGGNRPRDGTETDDRWRKCMALYVQDQTWHSDWGAKPGRPGCRVPEHILEEFRRQRAAANG